MVSMMCDKPPCPLLLRPLTVLALLTLLVLMPAPAALAEEGLASPMTVERFGGDEPSSSTPEVAWTRPLLFEARDAQGRSITLFGTFHMGIDLEREGPPVVLERLAASTMYVMEIDLIEANGAVLRHSLLPEGESLRELLGAELWAALEERLPQAAAFEHSRPWLVASLLVMQMVPNADRVAGMDTVLLERARGRGLPLGYLETAALQYEVVDQVLDLEALSRILRDWDGETARLEAVRQAFLAGDLTALERAVYHDALDAAERADLVRLLDERNVAWIPELERLIERGDVFVAFGAAHLFGEKGVIELLRQKGYTVERLGAD